jgi:acyl-CoA reductase-like NAD-dependent aldehyde dehydrogenase
VAFYTFTGSTRVGRIIMQAAGLRRTQMELGSIASTIVAADADLDRAIPKIANAGLRKAGQVCTSVQRLYVDRSIADEVAARLVDFAATLVAGDPRDPVSRVGPLITEQSAIRAEAWIQDAAQNGATLLCGGERSRSVIEPAVPGSVRPPDRASRLRRFRRGDSQRQRHGLRPRCGHLHAGHRPCPASGRDPSLRHGTDQRDLQCPV